MPVKNRRFLIFTLSCAFLAAGILYGIAATALPPYMRTLLTQNAAAWNTRIRIQDISLALTGRIILSNVILTDTHDNTLLDAKTIHIAPAYLSYLAGRTILGLRLENPRIYATRNQNGSWRIPQTPPQTGDTTPFGIINISCTNGTLVLDDAVKGFHTSISSIKALFSCGLSRLTFDVSAGASLNVRGNFAYATGTTTASLHATNIALQEYAALIPDSFILHSGVITHANIRIRLTARCALRGNITWQGAHIGRTNAAGEKIFSYTGNGTAQGVVSYAHTRWSCQTHIHTEDSSIYFPATDTITHITANLVYNGTMLSIKHARGIFKNALTDAQGTWHPSAHRLALTLQTSTTAGTILEALHSYRLLRYIPSASGPITLHAALRMQDATPRWMYTIQFQTPNIHIPLYAIQNTDAQGTITPQGIHIKKANGTFANLSFNAAGSLKNFTNPCIQAAITTQGSGAEYKNAYLQYTRIRNQLSPETLKTQPLWLSRIGNTGTGNLAINLTYSSSTALLEHTTRFTITSGSYQALRAINAVGTYTGNTLHIEKSDFVWQTNHIMLAGTLHDMNQRWKTIQVHAQSGMLHAKLDGTTDMNVIAAKKLLLQGYRSNIQCTGTLALNASERTRLAGKGTFNIRDTISCMRLLGLNPQRAKQAKLRGLYNAEFTIFGKGYPISCDINIRAQAPRFSLIGITGRNAKINFSRTNTTLSLNHFEAEIAGGTALLQAEINLQAPLYRWQLQTRDIDIARIIKQLPLRYKNLKGRLCADIDMESATLWPPSRIAGSGNITITNGFIWELHVLRGLGKFLFIEDFEKIHFYEGSAAALFRGNSILITKLFLKSLALDLAGSGSITLSGNLRGSLETRFNPLLLSASDDIRKHLTKLLGSGILTVAVNGTLSKPTYQIKPNFLNPFKGMGNFFKGLLQRDEE